MIPPELHRPDGAEASALLERWLGGAVPVLLGEGMEGCVYEIDADRVAKVWFNESAASLERVRPFYDALGAGRLPFAVPTMLELIEVNGRRVTIETRFSGTPLARLLDADEVDVDTARIKFVDVLAGLAGSGRVHQGRDLAVLDEPTPMYAPDESFADALGRLVKRRRQRFGNSLAPAVEDLDLKTNALVARLHEIDSGTRSVVHGDLTLGNILVDDATTPTAVLDWGFLSTEGDPAFDAAIACAIFDMYGDSALQSELELLSEVESRLGYSHECLLVYRAAYSLATANAYAADGSDGHFAWCVEALNRPDVVDAVMG